MLDTNAPNSMISDLIRQMTQTQTQMANTQINRLRQPAPMLDPGDPVAQTLQVLQSQGQLPENAPAHEALPPEAHIHSLMQNLLHNSAAAQDSGVGMRALAAIADILDAPRHAVQSMVGTDQGQMDEAYKRLAEIIPAPSATQLLSGPFGGLQSYGQQVFSGQDTGRRWSPETVKLVGDVATDPTSYIGVGIGKGLAKGAARVGAPVAVQKALQLAQAGDEGAAALLGKVGEGMIKGVQLGLFREPNRQLAKLFPDLPKWTEYARNTAAMGDALQWLESRHGLDLNTVQSGLKQGALTMQDVLGQLPTELATKIDPNQLEMALTRMPDSTTARNAAQWARTTNPTTDREVAYQNYKKWLLNDMGLDNPNRAATFYNQFTDWWKQQALASLSYIYSNAKSGVLGSLLTSGPGSAARTASDLLENAGNILAGQPFNTKRALDLSQKTGAPIPKSLHEMADNALSATSGPSVARTLLGSTARDAALGAGVGALGAYADDQSPLGVVGGALLGAGAMAKLPSVAARIRKSSQGVETVLRESGWVEGMSKGLVNELSNMERTIVEGLTEAGARGGPRQVTSTRTIPGKVSTTTIPEVPASVTGTPARAPVDYNLMSQGIHELYHETSPQEAANFLADISGSALKGLNVAPDPALALGQGAQGAVLKIVNTDQISGRALTSKPGSAMMAATGQGLPEYVIDHSALRPAEVVESVSIKPGATMNRTTQTQLDNLQKRGWTKTAQDDGTVVYTNGNIQPWASGVDVSPGTPAQTLTQTGPERQVTRTRTVQPTPVHQNFLDSLTDTVRQVGGQVNPEAIRKTLLNSVQVTPQRADEITRALDDALYSASQNGVRTSNKFNFDYQDLSNVERVMTQFFPFSTWYMKAIPFYTEQGFRHPVLANLVGAKAETSAQMQDQQGLPSRFAGTLPNQEQSAIVSKLVGRPLQAFYDPLAAMLPFGGMARDLQNLQFETQDNPDLFKIALGVLGAAGLGLNPAVATGMQVAGIGSDMGDPSNTSLLRWGGPLGGATALASRAVEGATGTNPGLYLNPNRGVEKVIDTIRQVGDAATHGGQGRQVTDPMELATERRVDELALKNTGLPIGSDDPAVAPYVRAKVAKSGPIWKQAQNEIHQERGSQSLLGFVSPDLAPNALLTPQESVIREAKGATLIDAPTARTIMQAASTDPNGRADPKILAAVQSATDQVVAQTGQGVPKPVQDRLANPTNANVAWVSGQIYAWETEQSPLLQGYGSGGSPEQRRIGNELGLMSHAGEDLTPEQQTVLVAANQASGLARGTASNRPTLRGSGPIAAAAAIPGNEKKAIEGNDPLLTEYLAWRSNNPGRTLEDFLKEKYGK